MSLFSELQSRFRGSGNREVSQPKLAEPFRRLEKKMGYRFKNIRLLELALTHPSYNIKNAKKPNNQRLEFLGDSILGAVLSAKLYELYPSEDEGSLSRKRSFFARGSHLAELGSYLQLDKVIKMSPSEISHKGNRRSSTLEDAVESLVGAVYLDGGFENARKCILDWIGDLRGKLDERKGSINPKGQLQEIVQAQYPKEKIRYNLIRQSGPDHAKSFVVELCLDGKKIAKGKGNSKKQAESSAAAKAIQHLISGSLKKES